MPMAPPLVTVGSWLASIREFSSSSGPCSIRAPREGQPSPGAVLAPSPQPGGGAPLDAPPAAPEVGRAFELEREHNVVRHDLFQEAMGAMNRLGEELASVDSRIEAEGLRLVEERRKC